jgi:hypothetical protein
MARMVTTIAPRTALTIDLRHVEELRPKPMLSPKDKLFGADKHIDLVPRRQPDLIPRGRDYLIYAGDRRVGRIYEVLTSPPHILLVALGAYVHQHSAKASARGITYSQTSVTTTPSDLLW